MNVATFVLFRILLLGWMTRWLTIHRDDVPILFFTVGSLGLATIVGMNIVLFYRILIGDYLGSKKKSDSDSSGGDNSDNDETDYKSAAKEQPLSSTSAANLTRRSHLGIVRSFFDEQND